jgi:hypothetical protein
LHEGREISDETINVQWTPLSGTVHNFLP